MVLNSTWTWVNRKISGFKKTFVNFSLRNSLLELNTVITKDSHEQDHNHCVKIRSWNYVIMIGSKSCERDYPKYNYIYSITWRYLVTLSTPKNLSIGVCRHQPGKSWPNLTRFLWHISGGCRGCVFDSPSLRGQWKIWN